MIHNYFPKQIYAYLIPTFILIVIITIYTTTVGLILI